MKTQMIAAVENRQKCRSNFRSVRDFPNSRLNTAGPGCEGAWATYQTLQRNMLEAELEVVRLAISGVPIADFSQRCKKEQKDPSRDDITFEIEQLFTFSASSAVGQLRHQISRRGITEAAQIELQKVIARVLKQPLNAFCDMADALAEALLNCIERQLEDVRVRLALARVLMYVSDCNRYSYHYEKAKDVAQLMQIISPTDPEAHMRLGINLALTQQPRSVVHTFFHYCVFLANRNVPVNHREAGVVHIFIKDATSEKSAGVQRVLGRKDTLFQKFVKHTWSLLCDDFDTAQQNVHDKEMWILFETCMQDGFEEDEFLDMIGVVIFAHFRCSTKANPNGLQLPQQELADFFVAKFLLISCQRIARDVKELCSVLRTRRKKRRRALQKKRRYDGTAVNPDPNVTLGYDVFKTMVPFHKSLPMFAPLSFLAYYWSKARSAPSPSVDLKPLGLILKTLQEVIGGLQKIAEATNVLQIMSHVDSKLLAGAEGLFPAMAEDLKFCSFSPCREFNMFRQTQLPATPLPSFMKRHSEGVVRRVLGSMEGKSYESVVSLTSKRHLDAFSRQCFSEIGVALDLVGQEAAGELVCITVRKFRLRRLIVDLEKVAGGKLARMSWHSSQENEGNGRADEPSPELPQPGQGTSLGPDENGKRGSAAVENLAEKVDQARRVMGNLTAFDVLESSPSSGFGDKQRKSRSTILAAALESSPLARGQGSRIRHNQFSKATNSGSRGRILSQGSLQLNYALDRNEEKTKQDDEVKRVGQSEISRILCKILYARDEECSPSQNGRPMPWRRPPKDDFSEIMFQSQAFRS